MNVQWFFVSTLWSSGMILKSVKTFFCLFGGFFFAVFVVFGGFLQKSGMVAKTTLAASAVKDASIKALAEARRRRALKRNKGKSPDKSLVSAPSSPASISRMSKRRIPHRIYDDITTGTDSETEASARSVEFSDASIECAPVVTTTPSQETFQALHPGDDREPAGAQSEDEMGISPGKRWCRKLFSDTPKGPRPLRMSVVQSSGQSSSDQPCSPTSSSPMEVKEEFRSTDLNKDQNESVLPPSSTKLMPSQSLSQSPNPGATTTFRPGSHDSKSGSNTHWSPPQVIASPVPKLLQLHQVEAQDKSGMGKVLHSSLRKRSFLRTTEAESGANSNRHSHRHGTRSCHAPPETKRKRPSMASSMVTRTQKRVEKNVSQLHQSQSIQVG